MDECYFKKKGLGGRQGKICERKTERQGKKEKLNIMPIPSDPMHH